MNYKVLSFVTHIPFAVTPMKLILHEARKNMSLGLPAQKNQDR